jgi:glycosyltransferase involved in cell wall biosynthesis
MTRSIRIAHVNVARGFRGGERQTELLIRELHRRKFPQVLVCRRGAPLAERVSDLPIQIRLSSGNPLSTFFRTAKVDIVHIHEGRSAYAGFLRSRVSGTPYLITRRVDNRIGNHRLAHKAYCEAAFVVAIAPAVADVLAEFDPKMHIRQISSSSSNLEVSEAATSAIRARFAGKFVVGHVGALDNHQKGQEYIIDAASRLKNSHPDVHFVLVGGGDDEAKLRESVASRQLSNITFTGFVDNVGDYLAAFDVFILPSNFEALGSILLDAMEHRLPIVASRVGGIPSLIGANETGLLIEPRRSDLLAESILRLQRDADLRQSLGAAAQRRAREYTPPAMCESYIALYEEMVAARS